MYHFADGGLERLRGTTDVYNNIAAGTIAGLVFKSSGAWPGSRRGCVAGIGLTVRAAHVVRIRGRSSAGVRPAALAAVIGGAIVGLYSVVEELIENNTTNVFYS